METELYVVGIGPGGMEYMTQEATDVLGRCDVIAGYTLYVDLIKASFPGKRWITTGMRREKERCLKALGEASKGYRTAVVCSGDAGVYGMAGLMRELTRERPDVKVRVVAGVTACLSGAALLGAPVGHDFCVISLSDLMTPWEVIEKRIDAAARADFCICLYNPMSRGRRDRLSRACDILLESKAPDTVCGYARKTGREGQEAGILPLSGLRDFEADMETTIFIGNRETQEIRGCMVTPRGYELGQETQHGVPKEPMNRVSEDRFQEGDKV